MESALRYIESLDMGDICILGEFFQMEYGISLEYPVEFYAVLDCWRLEKAVNDGKDSGNDRYV